MEDILRYLDREEIEEYETNQEMIGIVSLFRGYAVKVWKGIDFSSRKYHCLNKILIEHCVLYYKKCWDHRNKVLHDEGKQKQCALEWYKIIKKQVEEKEPLQVKMFVSRNRIDAERVGSKTLLQWIYNLKKIIKKVEKIPRNDIRRYFQN